MFDQPVEIGTLSPDVTLQTERDEPIALSDLWVDAERGIVLSFLRHYG